MSEIKDVVQWVKNETTGKSRTIKLGWAKEDKSGKLRINLDSLPVPRKNNFGDYSVELVLEEPRSRDQQQAPQRQPSGGAQFADDDDMPF